MTNIANVGTGVEAIDSLTPHPRNPNQGDVGAITESIGVHGFYGHVIAQKSSRTILAGEHRWKAAKAAGMDKIPVTWVDVDDEQALRIVLVDNRSGELAFRDPAGLVELLKELTETPSGLAGTGYDGDALDELLADLKPKPQHGQDEVTEPPAEPVTQPGDLWELGEHRLLCGDATDADAVARVLDGERPGMVLTDPPYGMDLDTDFSTILGSLGRQRGTQGKRYERVKGDDQDYDPGPVMAMFADVKEQFWWGADYYAERIPDRSKGSWLVWDKRKESQAEAIGSEFELCWSRQKHKRRVLRHDWFGFLSSENGSDARNRVHPTQKPVTLLVDIMEQWGKGCTSVVDLYGGSGSTLIAAEQTGRIARLIELDPGYCDVICRRYQNLTGTKPVRDGEPVDFLT